MRRIAIPLFAAAVALLPFARRSSAGAADPQSSAGVVAPQDEDGRKLYLKNCRQCHGATGQPSSETKHKYPKIRALNDSQFLAGISDDSILAVMKHGAGKDMKSFSDRLNPDEMAAVLKYVRTLPSKKGQGQ